MIREQNGEFDPLSRHAIDASTYHPSRAKETIRLRSIESWTLSRLFLAGRLERLEGIWNPRHQ
jgi:hypothetical protein